MFLFVCCNNSRCVLLKSLTRNRNITTSIRVFKSKRNFYEVLGVKQDCSQKEIKMAFIDLSKIHHPDSNIEKSCDKEFKEILEAYQVLSKPHSRVNYDLALKGVHQVNYVTRDTVHRPWEESSDKRYGPVEDTDNYYGIKGVKRMSNWKIVLACFIFCGLGICAQVIAIQRSFTFKREVMDERTSYYNAMHKRTREEAMSNSDISNLERVLNRMKESDTVK